MTASFTESGATTAALDVCGAQFNRLAADGTLLDRNDISVHGGRNVVLTCNLVDITRTENVGDDLTQRDPNGSGGYAAERVKAASPIGYSYKLVMSSAIDPELMDLFDLVDRIIDPGAGNKTIGFKAKDLSTVQCNCASVAVGYHGVAMHAWSLAWRGKLQRTDLPYIVEIAPHIEFTPGGDRQKNGTFNTVELNGDTQVNSLYGQGPNDIYPEVAGLDRHWAELMTATAWPGGCNCAACDGYVNDQSDGGPTPIEDAP